MSTKEYYRNSKGGILSGAYSRNILGKEESKGRNTKGIPTDNTLLQSTTEIILRTTACCHTEYTQGHQKTTKTITKVLLMQ
eukprot:1989251-Amphidinium_carterae.2